VADTRRTGFAVAIADLFRFGASSLLADIERQLDHHGSGYYSSDYWHLAG